MVKRDCEIDMNVAEAKVRVEWQIVQVLCKLSPSTHAKSHSVLSVLLYFALECVKCTSLMIISFDKNVSISVFSVIGHSDLDRIQVPIM